MKCFYCDTELEEKKIVDKVTEDDKTFIMKNVPVLYCKNCMEYFYSGDVSDNLEKMIDMYEKYKKYNAKSEIIVVDYDEMKKAIDEISN